MAVWALRARYAGPAVAIEGIIAAPLGSTPWVLFIGVIMWLATAAVTLGGGGPDTSSESRRGYWSMRFMLIHDMVYARPSAQRS